MRPVLVLDTSVFVSALLGPKGASREVVRRCLMRRYQPLMGAALFTEYESVLAREALLKRCILTKRERETLLDAFLSTCQWVNIYYAWRPNLTDESDNHLIELAVAGGAAAVVTHNVKDFKRSELRFPGLEVMTPADWLKEEI